MTSLLPAGAGPRTLIPLTSVLTCLLTVVAGGCSVASGGPPAGEATAREDMVARGVAYAECMRENGVPAFPDPQPDGSIELKAGPGLDPESAGFVAAEEACADLGPGGGPGAGPMDPDTQDRFLAFAQCMRDNGVPDFPDPDFSDRGVRLGVPEGVDPQSPGFLAAQETCESLMPGGPGGPGGPGSSGPGGPETTEEPGREGTVDTPASS